MMFPFNIWAVVVSALVSYGASSVWFLVLFREAYTKALGRTAEQLAAGPSIAVASVIQIIGNVVMAATLGWLMVELNMQNVAGGLILAAVVWVGFVAAVLGPMYAFQAFSIRFFFITAGSVLVSLLIMGVTLGVWK